MITSHGLNPILNIIDPYHGSLWASVEALSNYVAVGGDYKQASLINNYIWPFPDVQSLWSLDKSVDAVVDIMKAFKIPVISGKDSLSSTYRSPNGTVIKIPPVLCMSVFGKIPDVSKTISSDFKKEESIIYLIGNLDTQSMGGSVYYDIHGLSGKSVPRIDLKGLPALFTTIYSSIQKGIILSCHDISEGGLITALFEMCVGGGMGAEIEFSTQERPDTFLFNETAGCFLVEVEHEKQAETLFKKIPHIKLGKTMQAKNITTRYNRKIIFEADVELLKKSWQMPMKKLFP
jgi:phosphoribosylformylglycinamidine synthase